METMGRCRTQAALIVVSWMAEEIIEGGNDLLTDATGYDREAPGIW